MATNYQDFLAMLMSLSGDFISTYIVDLKTEDYIEYKATSEYEELGLAKHGEDFFAHTHKDAERVLFSDDLEAFKTAFTKENVLRHIAQKGVFVVHYRLHISGEIKPASTRITMAKENGEDKLIVGIRV
ncbi:MAG: hypothetical protein IKS40_01750 [Treponema sp.]|nr:hypothetical protein [Treponema sp.]